MTLHHFWTIAELAQQVTFVQNTSLARYLQLEWACGLQSASLAS
jgi:hypothetical protein